MLQGKGPEGLHTPSISEVQEAVLKPHVTENATQL
jgi:hypothetical protein